MRRVIAVVNQKGGVGKSTTSVNLAACLAGLGEHLLLVDLDPQANTTSGIGFQRPGSSDEPLSMGGPAASIYDALIGQTPLRSVTVPTPIPGVDLVPSSIDLAGIEVELAGLDGSERRLKEALLSVGHALVLLDCPPSLGIITVNALTAATELLIPIQCEYYALEGLKQLLGSIELVTKHLNPSLKIGGVLLTMYDSRTNLSDQVSAEVRRFFGPTVFDTVIPRSVRLAEAPSHGKPITTYDPTSRGAQAYQSLAREVIDRGRRP